MENIKYNRAVVSRHVEKVETVSGTKTLEYDT